MWSPKASDEDLIHTIMLLDELGRTMNMLMAAYSSNFESQHWSSVLPLDHQEDRGNTHDSFLSFLTGCNLSSIVDRKLQTYEGQKVR